MRCGFFLHSVLKRFHSIVFILVYYLMIHLLYSSVGNLIFFPLAASKILSFSLIFSSLNMIGLLVCFFYFGINPALYSLSFFDLLFAVFLI